MEMVEVVGNVDVEFGSISKIECCLLLRFCLDLLYSLSYYVEFGTGLYLRCFGFRERLDRAG